ncbi:hypothetical protein PWT90_10297 [Aphanocladium album]|nr:hypothetical protein PWT90_10297 [Aphanocladium album]
MSKRSCPVQQLLLHEHTATGQLFDLRSAKMCLFGPDSAAQHYHVLMPWFPPAVAQTRTDSAHHCTTMGFGLHVWDTDPKHTATIHQIFWVLEIAYLLSITLMKASVVLLMGRVFETPGWRKLTRYSLIILAAKVVAFLFPLVFQCAPVRAVWDPDVEGKCLSLPAMTMVGAGLSISEDLVLMALPIPTLLKLPLDKSRQMLLIGLFGVGSFACVTSLVRIKPLLKFSDTDDLTWDYVDVVVWTGIEVVAALVCGSLPPCRQLIMRFCSYVSSLVANSSSRRREDIIVEVVEVTSGNSKLLQSQSNVRKESTATTDTASACAC